MASFIGKSFGDGRLPDHATSIFHGRPPHLPLAFDAFARATAAS
jgi:hypothetical protein